jgi:glycogen debranching enzyme
VFAIRGLWDKQPGTARGPRWEDDNLIFAYDGADDIKRRLVAQFQPHPGSRNGTQVDYHLELGPREQCEIKISFVISEQMADEDSPDAGPGESSQSRLRGHQAEVSEKWLVDRAEIETDSLLLNAVLARSLRDLRMLRNHIDGDEYFAAGVPWYATLFGRDSIITALQTLAFDPEMAGQILELLARYQAKEMDPWRDAEPGKILHELRIGELARIGEIPHSPYYGSIDATPLFLILVARHAAWTGSVSLFVTLREQVEAALEWMDRYGDLDGDGYLEYDSPVGLGLVNQGWKDSGSGIIDEHGNLPKPPIALVEVQGYAYQARMEVAGLFEAAGDPDRANELRKQAQALRAQFNNDFWLEDEGFYALALQAKDEPIRVITSNAGHALWSGIADREKGRKVGQRLMEPDLFSGWGIRTLSADNGCYNPTAYHLGTVWPHDNAIIAAGLRRYGLDHAAHRVFAGMIEATMHFEDYRLPELFAGFSREEYDVPVPYPVACHPQAWSAGAIPFLLTTLLGIVPDAFAGQLRIVRPVLPDMVDRIHVRDLSIGRGSVDLSFQRTGAEQCAVNIDAVQGDIDVVLDMEHDG